MDHKYHSLFKAEARKLLWLLAMCVTVVLLIQYTELPSPLFSGAKAPFAGDGIALDFASGPSYVREGFDDQNYFEGNGHVLGNETLLEGDIESKSNISSGADDFRIGLDGGSVSVKEVDDSGSGNATEEDAVPDFMLDSSTVNGTVDGDSSSSRAISPVTSEHRVTSYLNNSPALAPVLPPSAFTQHVTSLTNADDRITSRSTETRGSADAIHEEERPQPPPPAVVPVSEMNRLFDQSISTYRSMKPRWSSAVDKELASAKTKILGAPIIPDDPVLYAPLFRNVSMFKRSYELMEETLKVYIYKEGEKPILHQPVLKGIYASEGWFMKQMKASRTFVTKDARKAHLFYLPFSSRNLEETLYVPNSHSHRNLVRYLKDYLDLIGAKHPFWNRTSGADHFLAACHDWAPAETKRIMGRCIRSLCNSDIKEGFVFGKDASLPETFVQNPQRPLRALGGKPPSKRSILAFFAGNMHGYLRPLLLQHWGDNRDPDMRIFGHLPPKAKGTMSYAQHMKSSKYCICARGYEVNSPRVVEAIFYECVPVIISDDFVPPFFEVLDWESFAVFVLEKDIPNLKEILLSIPEKRYREMQMRVKNVQKHFLWNPRPVKYDVFHMILHSVWYNRVLHVNPR